tara:strand:+ start:225 stop:1040 length:816 start_codon:yes stop_codon:yes gene_type:complete
VGGAYEGIVSASYVLTMANSNRLSTIKDELNKFQPTEIVYFQINEGYNKCPKKSVDSTTLDLCDAVATAAKHALNHGHKQVFIFEDDVFFNPKFTSAETRGVVRDQLNKSETNKIPTQLSLGSLPFVSFPSTYRDVRWTLVSTGTHATVLNYWALKQMSGTNVSECQDYDTWGHANFFRYTLATPVAFQRYEKTENSAQWGKPYGIIGRFAATLLQLVYKILSIDSSDKAVVENGYLTLTTLNIWLFDILLPLFIFLKTLQLTNRPVRKKY